MRVTKAVAARSSSASAPRTAAAISAAAVMARTCSRPSSVGRSHPPAVGALPAAGDEARLLEPTDQGRRRAGGHPDPAPRLEVLRGDLARVVLDALPDGVDLRYGETITEVDDGAVDDGPDGAVTVTTSSGERLRADLLVIAEGVRSSTRDLVFDGQVERRELGISMVFGTIARTASDADRWRWLTTTGGRQVHLRPDPYGTTRAILAVARAGSLVDLERQQATARLREVLADAGWEAPRVLDGFATSDDVYVDDLTQVRMSTCHSGRVVRVGDAGWCVTPMGGGGASLALVGGYVLAAQPAAEESTREGVEAGLAAYERWVRPLVADVQDRPRWVERFAYPQTRYGLAARRAFDTVLLRMPLRRLAARSTEVAQTDRELPAASA